MTSALPELLKALTRPTPRWSIIADFSTTTTDRFVCALSLTPPQAAPGEDVDEARVGNRVSVAIDGPTVGRQIKEEDELWIELPEKHAKILEQELSDDIPGDELEALRMYLDKQRKRDPFWGK